MKFKAAFGDIDKEVELSQAAGAGSSYHLYIDRFYQGQFVHYLTGWEFTYNGKCDLTSDDIDVLMEMVLEMEGL